MPLTQRTRRSPALGALAPALALALACRRGVPLPSLEAAATGDTTGLVARGEYIVRNAAVCGHCHAADPRSSDGPLSGGTEFRDWRIGTARAANLTPDSATGLGAWSEAEIVRALRSGQARSGRLLAPVMPYEWLHDMSDRDALAVARYLRSLAPVHRAVRQRPSLALRLGKLLFLRPKRTESRTAPAAGPTAAHGGYLAQHVAFCADCHTPRSGLRSRPDRRRLFAGTAKPPKGFPANPTNLTPDSATGIGRWSEEDFLRTLRTGVNPRGDSLHAFMPWREVGRMTDDDLIAIYRFLNTLPPIRNAVPRRGR